MPKTSAKTKAAQRAELKNLEKQFADTLKSLKIKSNPSLLMLAVYALMPLMVKTGLLYMALRLGFHLSQAAIDWVIMKVREGMGLEEAVAAAPK